MEKAIEQLEDMQHRVNNGGRLNKLDMFVIKDTMQHCKNNGDANDVLKTLKIILEKSLKSTLKAERGLTLV
jgi:hypothetical protein